MDESNCGFAKSTLLYCFSILILPWQIYCKQEKIISKNGLAYADSGCKKTAFFHQLL